MSAIFSRRRPRVTLKDCISGARQFWVSQSAVFVKSFTSSVCENDSQKSLTVSYLINSCGLSSSVASSISNKLSFKSQENPDAVLKLLREYGFTDVHIPRLVTGWPSVLLACPNKNLLPKLEFFRSIGVPVPVLAQNLSRQPSVLTRSLENSIIPFYSYLTSVLRSDEGVVRVFTRAPRAFGWSWGKLISSNISMLKERGMPQSSIVLLVPILVLSGEKLAGYVDRVVEMGFDISKSGFRQALQVFIQTNESTWKRKMEMYRRCGWSESDVLAAFLKNPLCMKYSEKKILSAMDFFVNKLGYDPVFVAERPGLLGYSLEKRIKPRFLVAGILNEKGLKNMSFGTSLISVSEKEFLTSYILEYRKDIPELLDIYEGKLSLPEMCFSRGVISK